MMTQELPFGLQSPGIGGKIKHRVGDFVVQEIGLDGKACAILSLFENEKKELEHSIPENPLGLEQLHIQLEKFSYTTVNAIDMLSRATQCSRKRFGFAGMKDKRAITSQWISIWKPDTERLMDFKSRFLEWHDARWSGKRLGLGDAQGNHFTIAVRDLELEEKEIEKRLKAIFSEMRHGIPNYFGEQRFGGARDVTHEVGKAILKEDLEAAVWLYLTKPGSDRDESNEMRKALGETKDVRKALGDFPRKFRMERSMLGHLAKNPDDFAGALQSVPKNLTYLFVHALQSDLYNQIIRKRIEQGIGLKAVEGDMLEDEVPTAPLFGTRTTFATGAPGEIERSVLEENGMTLEDFNSERFPIASSQGERRKIALVPQQLKLDDVSADEFFGGKRKAVISFSLEKGCYATTVLREITKTAEACACSSIPASID